MTALEAAAVIQDAEGDRLKWRRRANGYYEATGLTGIGVLVMRADHGMWQVFAGDQTKCRGSYPRLAIAKYYASVMFG